MSPCRKGDQVAISGFPRVSGDEPVGKDIPFVFAPFSPRERG